MCNQGCGGGSAGGCTNLAWLYEKGYGVKRDYALAGYLYKQGCDGGRRNGGCTNLGWLYEKGYGVKGDYALARSLYEQGSEHHAIPPSSS